MKIKMKIILVLLLSILYLSSSSQLFNIPDNFNSTSEDNKNEINFINSSVNKVKIATCISLVRNYLNIANDFVKKILKESKIDKVKTYDKMILLMIDNCQSNITQEDLMTILTPDNITKIDKKLTSLLDITLTSEIFLDPFYEITFSDEDKSILRQINQVVSSEEVEVFDEVEITIANSEKFKYLGLGAGSMFLLILLFKYLFFRTNKSQFEPKVKGNKKKNK